MFLLALQGVYQLASTEGEAAKLSLHAGVDMDFAGCSYSHLEAEVKAGRVDVADLDRAVSNVLRVKFATGMFDRPANITMRKPEELDTPAFRKVVREAAEQSIVLLINKKMEGERVYPPFWEHERALPLVLSGAGKIGSMLLAGPLIDDANSQNGGYSHGGAPTSTILEAAQAAAKAGGFELTSLHGTSNGTLGTGSVAANDAAS
jgi:beta-glucosidase